MSDLNEGNRSAVLEGMYKSFAGQIEDVRTAVSRELQYGAAQQVSSYEALSENIRRSLETMLAEMRFLSQQNSSIYDFTEKTRTADREALLEAVKKGAEETAQKCADLVGRASEEWKRSLEEGLARVKKEILSELSMPAANAVGVKLDYDLLAGKVAEKLPAPVYEQPAYAAEPYATVSSYEEPYESYEEPKEAQTAAVAEPDFSALPEIDGDELAEKIARKLPLELAANAVDVDALAAKLAERLPEAFSVADSVDYDVLAEKIATILPETDYDTLAEKVAAAAGNDPDTVADRVLAVLPQTDEGALADRIAESVTPVDYDLIAERVSSVLENEFDLTVDEEGVDRIARGVSAELSLGEKTLSDEEVERIASALAERLRGGIAVRPETTVAAAVAVPVPFKGEDEETEMTTRYKRSFEAKIIESDREIKQYYSEIKNALLSYGKVRSQVSWSNDRYTVNRETVAKVGVRGKTLCLYLALNPDEFPATIYHQKYAGDTKMYEKTPMMLKIKSPIAARRATKLISLLMERYGLVQDEGYAAADYVATYAPRSEEELLAEGLIKTATVEKSALDF